MKEQDEQAADRIYQDALLACDGAYDKVKAEMSDIIDLETIPMARIVNLIYKKGFSQGMHYSSTVRDKIREGIKT